MRRRNASDPLVRFYLAHGVTENERAEQLVAPRTELGPLTHTVLVRLPEQALLHGASAHAVDARRAFIEAIACDGCFARLLYVACSRANRRVTLNDHSSFGASIRKELSFISENGFGYRLEESIARECHSLLTYQCLEDGLKISPDTNRISPPMEVLLKSDIEYHQLLKLLMCIYRYIGDVQVRVVISGLSGICRHRLRYTREQNWDAVIRMIQEVAKQSSAELILVGNLFCLFDERRGAASYERIKQILGLDLLGTYGLHRQILCLSRSAFLESNQCGMTPIFH